MNRVRSIFTFLVLVLPFFASAGGGFVYLKDSTQKLFFVSDNAIYTPDRGQLLYTQRGNIFYGGKDDNKDQISLLVTSLDPASTRLEMIYEKDQRQPVYSFMDNAFFLGKANTDEARRKNELIHIESSKKWVGFYESDNDSLLAYYRVDSFPSSTAIIVAYTIIKKFDLEQKIAAQRPQSSQEKGIFSVLKILPSQQQVPPVTGAYSIIKPAWGNALANEWIWDGKVLRPRWNVDENLRWTFDGQTIKKESTNEQYVWDGKLLKPSEGDDPTQQWNWNGSTMKRLENSGWHNEYKIEDGVVMPTSNAQPENEWYVDGNIPIPLIILIITGIAKTN